MKILGLFLFLLASRISLAQDSTVTWMRTMDTMDFQLHLNKKVIPRAFYSALNIQNIRKLANPSDIYSPSCINPIRGQLNWLAKNKNHWVISITYGSNAICTRYFFIDKNNKKLNFNEIVFNSASRKKMTFSEVVLALKTRNYTFEKFESKN